MDIFHKKLDEFCPIRSQVLHSAHELRLKLVNVGGLRIKKTTRRINLFAHTTAGIFQLYSAWPVVCVKFTPNEKYPIIQLTPRWKIVSKSRNSIPAGHHREIWGPSKPDTLWRNHRHRQLGLSWVGEMTTQIFSSPLSKKHSDDWSIPFILSTTKCPSTHYRCFTIEWSAMIAFRFSVPRCCLAFFLFFWRISCKRQSKCIRANIFSKISASMHVFTCQIAQKIWKKRKKQDSHLQRSRPKSLKPMKYEVA